MQQDQFVQSHPMHTFSENDKTDYSNRDKYFIQCLKAQENITDMDAYIVDYKNQQVLYATRGGTLHHHKIYQQDRHFNPFTHLNALISPEDMPVVSFINYKVFDFFYSLPAKRRLNAYFTYDFKIKGKRNNTVLINHKSTVLDLTDDGTLRLSLNIISYPTSEKTGNVYIKMTDTNTIYEFIKYSEKFVEIKTQKITSKASNILQLASTGKTEIQIANELEISLNTVKYHKKKIFSQLGVKNIAEAIQWMNNQKNMIRR